MEYDAPIEKTAIQKYKAICAKLGIVMCVYFICRILSSIVVELLIRLIGGTGSAAYYLSYAVVVVMVYCVPLLVTALVFDSRNEYRGKLRELYSRPRRLARALGTFPAMYGLGLGIALLTLLISYMITRITGGQTLIEDMLRPTVIEPPVSIASALVMVFMLVVIAPVFEEIWTRGIIYDALKPYGNGIAIIFSSVLFGLMHGSMHMLFYTTALGFALGYIRYATNSLFVVTILHAIINAVAAGFLFLSSLSEITYGANRLVNTFLNVYTLAWLVLIVVGVIVFITRIPMIKTYRIGNTWNEISSGRKTAIFFTSIPVMIMLVLAFNEHTNNWLISLIFQ
jgi:membrane protease YdiL (CAAX protease family)